MTVQTVTIDQCKAQAQTGTLPTILDVRTPAEYARTHATGAVLLPLDMISTAEVERHRQGDGVLYLICEKGQRAAKAWAQLDAAGAQNMVCIEGGTQAWRAAGLPVVCGRGMISLERQVRIGAGSLVLLGLVLGWAVHPALAGLSALVGAGLVFAGITDFCGMALLLARVPWNRGSRDDVKARPPLQV